jgi:hypothetical protein
MLYFDTLPRIVTPDQNGNPLLLTNILTRAKLLESLQDNPMLFYEYNIQDGDTPEIIAEKYYDDPYRFWMVLYSNNLLDPLWDWPMAERQFTVYLESLYADDAAAANLSVYDYINTTIYVYQKVVTTTDLVTDTITVEALTIDFDTYQSLELGTNTYTLPNGTKVIVSISKNAMTIYEHEYAMNEAKRKIKLLNNNYVGQMEQTFKQVMK